MKNVSIQTLQAIFKSRKVRSINWLILCLQRQIPHQWIRKHSTHYQAHLERISDYLKFGQGVWWEDN